MQQEGEKNYAVEKIALYLGNLPDAPFSVISRFFAPKDNESDRAKCS